MYPIPPNEKFIETKVCKHCGNSFPITDKDMEFYDKVSPTFGGKKYQIPTPTLCPDCRQQRRLSYRMERKLYKRKCDATGKDIISMYSPDKSDIVYEYSHWWGDTWDPLDYGREFDFSRSFFDQLKELSLVVPKCHIEISPSENSTYTNQAGYNKNCYLTFEAGYDEDCAYGNSVWNSKDSYDNSFIFYDEQCYGCLDVKHSYNVAYSIECYNCRDSLYLYDCQNCEYCIGCSNLRNKKYHILNKVVSREQFESFKQDLQKPGKMAEFEKLWEQQKNQIIHRENDNLQSEKVIGNHILQSKNVIGYDLTNTEDVRYGYAVYHSEDCMDYVYWGNKATRVYEAISAGNGADNILFSYMCYDEVQNLIYCSNCVTGTQNCFACVGLKGKQYCILNRQYTKEEYETLVPKIIEHMMKTGEWGEFFPASLSSFGYNETVAQEYYPLTKEQATKDGVFNWSDYEAPFPKVDKVIDKEGMKKLPEDITKIPDDILNWALTCEVTEKPFRIIKQELDFYRKHHLPIPRRHPDQRHLDRMAQRNPRKLFERKCDKCRKDMITTYAPDRPEIVYCEECYNREVVG